MAESAGAHRWCQRRRAHGDAAAAHSGSMAALLLRCFVDAGLRYEGRPLVVWLRDVATQAGAVVHQAGAGLGLKGSVRCSALLDLSLHVAELCFQATPQQCAVISRRLARARVPVFLMKVLDTELSTFFAPA